MKENNMTFERLGDLRPHGSRLNLDSFENFNKTEVEKKVELRKQLLIKKINLLKSLEQEEGQAEVIKELSELYNIEEKDLNKAIDNVLEKGGFGSGKYAHKKKPLPAKGTSEWHKIQVAKKTMKMSEAGAQIMGGQTKEEAEKILKEYDLLKSEIDALEKANKGYPIGTIRNGYKKIAEGKWRKVNDFEKGIMSDLSYSINGKEGLNFAKTGKEIKAQLPAMISKLQTKLTALQTKQAELVEEIGVAPDEESIFYGTDEIYKRYSSNLCYGEKGSDLSNNTSTDEQKLMRQYNDFQYRVNDLKRDISIGEAMVRNLDDKKKYTLSISQIASLGF